MIRTYSQYEKSYTQNASEEVSVIKKVKNTVLWTCVISDLNVEKFFEMFYKKIFQKTNKKEFKVEKVTKRKCGKLSVKLKGYSNSLNSLIDKEHINE